MSGNSEKVQSALNEIKKGLVGQEDFAEGLLLSVISDGHLLIEGLPGLAKTRAVNLLAKVCSLGFKRIQFTPDLLPADIIGTRIFNQSRSDFEISKGPVFSNFILADEINRAPAKVQSALLEAMQERQVTISDTTFPLPKPFFVFATQNPVEQEGTYPLPEAQLDRFIMKINVEYPSQKEEAQIVRMIMNETSLPEVRKVLEPQDILNLQAEARKIHIEEKIISYITNITQATRNPSEFKLDLSDIIQYGVSPRASIAMAVLSRARAFMRGRNAVLPEDVKAVAYPALRHRLILTYHAEAENIRPDAVISKILDNIKVP